MIYHVSMVSLRGSYILYLAILNSKSLRILIFCDLFLKAWAYGKKGVMFMWHNKHHLIIIIIIIIIIFVIVKVSHHLIYNSLFVNVIANIFQQLLFMINTLRTGDADLRFYITTVQDGWRKSAFVTRACFPCTIHLIMQYIEPVSEWSCWRMFIETWPHSELNFGHRASSI